VFIAKKNTEMSIRAIVSATNKPPNTPLTNGWYIVVVMHTTVLPITHGHPLEDALHNNSGVSKIPTILSQRHSQLKMY